MKKTAQYYWNKVMEKDFQERYISLNAMLEVAERHLSKDELTHLKEILND